MATKENSSGLLSKVAKFVRNPTTNWTDLDRQDPEPAAGYSKQALKEMIERKRQNDFVRKREFDQLRKLRSLGPSSSNPDLTGRPSYFQSSLPSSSDDRAMTIKKIDEIEAQMSNQWWQGKNDGVRASGSARAAAGATPGPTIVSTWDPIVTTPADDDAYEPTRLSPMVPNPTLTGSEVSDFPATQTNSSFGRNAPWEPTPLPFEPAARGVTAPPATALRPNEASVALPSEPSEPSEPFAAELVDEATDADLEEAAIRFANGDNLGAESGLLAALTNRSARQDHALVWSLALFDLYRATGQQARFDMAAIEFAERFGRSAPAWFSIPEMLGISPDDAIRTQPSQLSTEPLWQSPTRFTDASIDELLLAVANAPSPWYLDWRAIETLTPQAIAPLGKLFSQWCNNPVHLRFAGSAALERVLRSCARSGNKSVDQANWRLRLEALRVMHQQDEFELVALDFCVTFEVSPPTWEDARCSFVDEASHSSEARQEDAPATATGGREVRRRAADEVTMLMGLDTGAAAVVELAGHILGEATEALTQLEAGCQGQDRLVVSCPRLIRVDFSAAGSLLNWVAMRQAEGCQLQFRDVHRLVGAFFNVVGINEHARVLVRSD